jgi:hypothetical protein
MFFLGLGLASGCVLPTPTPVALQQLRIANSGTSDIIGLTILFPGPTDDAAATRIEFGDIPAGKTTGYRRVPGGVYRYAAFEYTLGGQLVNQPVVDWIGERPMQGTKFTYRIALDPGMLPGGQIQLIEVRGDGSQSS